jgi:hypothetical protein
MQPDQPDLATALAKHLCEFDACSDPAPCPDHLTVAGAALKFLGAHADVDAAYQRGLADGRRQATDGFQRQWGGPDGGESLYRLVGPWETAEQPEGSAS